jgi:hypothetical protein
VELGQHEMDREAAMDAQGSRQGEAVAAPRGVGAAPAEAEGRGPHSRVARKFWPKMPLATGLQG